MPFFALTSGLLKQLRSSSVPGIVSLQNCEQPSCRGIVKRSCHGELRCLLLNQKGRVVFVARTPDRLDCSRFVAELELKPGCEAQAGANGLLRSPQAGAASFKSLKSDYFGFLSALEICDSRREPGACLGAEALLTPASRGAC